MQTVCQQKIIFHAAYAPTAGCGLRDSFFIHIWTLMGTYASRRGRVDVTARPEVGTT